MLRVGSTCSTMAQVGVLGFRVHCVEGCVSTVLAGSSLRLLSTHQKYSVCIAQTNCSPRWLNPFLVLACFKRLGFLLANTSSFHISQRIA